MSQSLVQVYVHIVFSTKDRCPFLKDKELRDRAHAYLAKICHNQGSPSLKVGGVEDHVHILCRLAKVSSMSHLLQELKRESSKWIKKQDPALKEFYWQGGYGAFSVSPAEVDDVLAYIENQEEHHQHESFKDEFAAFANDTDWQSMNGTCGIDSWRRAHRPVLCNACGVKDVWWTVTQGALATLGCGI